MVNVLAAVGLARIDGVVVDDIVAAIGRPPSLFRLVSVVSAHSVRR